MEDATRFAITPGLSCIDFTDPDGIRAFIKDRHRDLFGVTDDNYVDEYLDMVNDLFAGRYPGLQAIDTAYHDISHTLQATLCLVELLSTRHISNDEPRIGTHQFKLALVAVLFHDTGYLKTLEDTEGTGAKYTNVHESRSCAYARLFLTKRGWTPHNIRAIENMISATGPSSDLTRINFQNNTERLLGQAVCTADYIGQMSDPDYPDKLEVLYKEFEESYRYQRIPRDAWPFKSYEALLRGTPSFWTVFVHRKMTVECDNLWRHLKHSDPGTIRYIDAIENNLNEIERRIGQLDNA